MKKLPPFDFSETTEMVCKDYTVSHKFFELKRENQFDLLGTFPRPKENELPEFYKSEKYISHTDSKNSIFEKVYQKVKSYMLQKKLEWIEKEKKGRGKLLDIGAGTGDFLAEAKKKGYDVFGVEPNSGAKQLALKKGISLKENTSSFPDEEFDVITMWHVLEHVPDLEDQVNELFRVLKKDGLLVVAVPNFKSYDANVYKEHWAAFDVPRHLYHFSRTSIQKIFSEFNFEVIKEKGLPFDSYYVSLLSENYRNGKGNPLKAAFTGFISNQKAKDTGEYSSIAYFLKKQ
nr:class I SAM-dependent methyltransferase [Salinimicrobium catena]